jgi:hypothetical protein
LARAKCGQIPDLRHYDADPATIGRRSSRLERSNGWQFSVDPAAVMPRVSIEAGSSADG